MGYSAQAPAPTSSNPLGVAFPGQPVNEPGLPNWIGYLIRDHGHGHANMVAYDYARRGDTVTGVYTNQVSREFLPTVGRRPAWAFWTPSDSIFGTHHLVHPSSVFNCELSHLDWCKRLQNFVS